MATYLVNNGVSTFEISIEGNFVRALNSTADLDDSTDRRYVTDADLIDIGNLSGVNTGDQDLSGLVPKTTTVNSKALNANIVLDKTDIGLSNVPNTDATIASNITQDSTHRFATDAEKVAWNAKQEALGYTPEDVANKQTTLVASATNYPTVNAVNTGLSAKQDSLGFTAVPDSRTINGHALTSNVSVTQSDIGLANVNNTSDANKPVSTATQTALNSKLDKNTAIVAATNTKITYDANGLVTAGTSATTADIADSSDKRYVTDAQLVTIGNTSNTNSGDNATNSQYSGLVSNATHTGDATGATALTVVGINNTNMAALGTGILKNTTTTGVPSIAIAADFPTLNQNTTGNAATVTTIPTLSGEVTNVGNAITLVNSSVIGKVLTAFSAGAGVVAATDTILQAFNKIVGNIALKLTANIAITGATKTKITYDANGLVTSGADATTADIADSTNKRYVSDAQLTVIGNTSGTNTGDQDLSSYATQAWVGLQGYVTNVITALGYTPENVVNKSTTFTTVNDTLYPSVKAVQTEILAALSPQASYFAYKTASDVGGYYKFLSYPSTGSSQSVTYVNATGTVTVAAFATEPSQPSKTHIPIGWFKTHIHASRTGAGTAVIFCEIYKRSSLGVETLLLTTPTTVTALTTSILEYNLEVYNPSILILLSTDRLVCKWRTTVSSGTPDVNIFIEDNYLSRMDAPVVPLTVSPNTTNVTVDFGSSFTDKATTVVTGQSWVTSTSCITGNVLTPAGVDTDELRLLGFEVVISDLVVGIGFTITVYSEAEAKGTYNIMCIGI